MDTSLSHKSNTFSLFFSPGSLYNNHHTYSRRKRDHKS
ncbi:hypothetical protein AAZX31_02G106000 [Glycine max]